MSEELDKNLGVDINSETGNFMVQQNNEAGDLEMKGDFPNDHDPKTHMELHEAGQEDGNDEKELTPEEIERQCAEIAEKYIVDIKDYGRTIPVRFSFSGLAPSILKNGFRDSPFVNDADSKGYRRDQLFYTRNEQFTIAGSGMRGKLIFGDSERLFFSRIENLSEQEIEAKYNNFPELNDALEERDQIVETHMKMRENLGITDKDGEITSKIFKYLSSEIKEKMDSLSSDELSDFIYIEEKMKLQPNPQSIYDITKEGNEAEFNHEMTIKIIKNFMTFKRLGEWTFEEQEYWYNSVVKNQITEHPAATNDRQVYDMAYLINPDSIDESKQGYLGDEILITAPASSILGIVFTRSEGNVWANFIKEKMKKLYSTNIDLSRPVYDESGYLIWPRKMSYEDVKKFVAKRDKAKESEQETEKQEGEQ